MCYLFPCCKTTLILCSSYSLYSLSPIRLLLLCYVLCAFPYVCVPCSLSARLRFSLSPCHLFQYHNAVSTHDLQGQWNNWIDLFHMCQHRIAFAGSLFLSAFLVLPLSFIPSLSSTGLSARSVFLSFAYGSPSFSFSFSIFLPSHYHY